MLGKNYIQRKNFIVNLKKDNMTKKIFMISGLIFVLLSVYLLYKLEFFQFVKSNYELIWLLIIQHLKLVGISSIIATGIGVSIGILLTRGFMKHYMKAILNLLGICQTVPSLAVIAISMTYLGVGMTTAIFALIIYSLFPIIRNCVAGISNVDPVILEAGRGMGMTSLQILFKVEIPNSISIILSGIRISTVINVGTAALSFLVGGGGLGDLIFTGIALVDPVYMLAGAIPTAVLAILFNRFFEYIEGVIISPGISMRKAEV